MVVKIFSGPFDYDISSLYTSDVNEFLIGVDKGAYLAITNGLTLDLALGDFDSVTNVELDMIKKRSIEIQIHSDMKDYTDTYLAVKHALSLDPDEIVIYGGVGKRFDHSLANIELLKLGRISIVSQTSKLYMLDPGEYEIENHYKYISFFPVEDVRDLTLTGFKYEVVDKQVSVENPILVSNEGSGVLSFKEGLLLVVHQDE